MARVVKSQKEQVISCHLVTELESGESIVKDFNRGDKISIRYLKGENIKTVYGRVVDYKLDCKSSIVYVNYPIDNFATDIVVTGVILDASREYVSDVYDINVEDIIEDEGIMYATEIYIYASIVVKLEVEYTDGIIAKQELQVGDILKNFTYISQDDDTTYKTGDYQIAAFGYVIIDNYPKVLGLYLVPIDGKTDNIYVPFTRIISFNEIPQVTIDDPTSMSAIADVLNRSETGEAYVTLGVDVTIPKREDGRITTTSIGPGKTLNLDLGGHTIDCQAYAFYVNGGTLNIRGEGTIKTEALDAAYPAIMVLNGSTCNMYSGCIDTTQAEVPEGHDNWIYGVVCSGDGVFNMYGGEMKIYGAAGISITNGTASGSGAQFTIGGNSIISSVDCASVYLADNKSVVIKDNAKLYGGIVARMGDITIMNNAIVEANSDPDHVYPLGEQVTMSGVIGPAAGILALTGCYTSELGNDMNILVSTSGRVKSNLGNGIEIATINTKYDQKVNVTIRNSDTIEYPEGKDVYKVYNHAELEELAREQGRTLPAETSTTDLTIKVNGEVVNNE